MVSKRLLAGAIAALVSSGLFVAAQQPVIKPLEAMPYSPSLDTTSLDKTADPCVDFYKFSCGGWMKNNPIPVDQASWSVYGKLATENQQFLWGILEEDAKAKNRTAVQQKVGDYFGACMNTAAIDALGDKPVVGALAKIDALKTREELIAAIATLDKSEMGSFFFNVGTEQDAADSSVMIVGTGAGGLGLPDRDYYTKTDDKSVKIREQYVAYIAQLLTLAGETDEHAKADAASILGIETALAKAQLTRVEQRDPHNIYHMMPIGDLETLAPSIDWARFFAIHDAPGVQKLNVSQPAFLKAVNAELTTEPVEKRGLICGSIC